MRKERAIADSNLWDYFLHFFFTKCFKIHPIKNIQIITSPNIIIPTDPIHPIPITVATSNINNVINKIVNRIIFNSSLKIYFISHNRNCKICEKKEPQIFPRLHFLICGYSWFHLQCMELSYQSQNQQYQ